MLNFLVFLVRHSKMYKLVFEQMFSFEENKSNSIKKREWNLHTRFFSCLGCLYKSCYHINWFLLLKFFNELNIDVIQISISPNIQDNTGLVIKFLKDIFTSAIELTQRNIVTFCKVECHLMIKDAWNQLIMGVYTVLQIWYVYKQNLRNMQIAKKTYSFSLWTPSIQWSNNLQNDFDKKRACWWVAYSLWAVAVTSSNDVCLCVCIGMMNSSPTPGAVPS